MRKMLILFSALMVGFFALADEGALTAMQRVARYVESLGRYRVDFALKSGDFSAKGYYFEDAKQFAEHFKLLAGAIYKRQQIELLYSDQVRIIQPYRLIHHHGIWYLAGVIQGELKTYRLSQLQQVKLVFKAESFEHDSEVLKMLTDEDSIWFGRQKQQVLVKVQPAVTVFFKERRLFPEQQIEQELESGELLISCQIRHEMQLLPLVRYWLPYVKIIEPIHFQQKLEQDLQGYLRSAG